jgi:hypothetical protein
MIYVTLSGAGCVMFAEFYILWLYAIDSTVIPLLGSYQTYSVVSFAHVICGFALLSFYAVFATYSYPLGRRKSESGLVGERNSH